MADDFCDPHCPFLGCASCQYLGYPQRPVDENGCQTTTSGRIGSMETAPETPPSTHEGGAENAP
jgi:hypothetical protein